MYLITKLIQKIDFFKNFFNQVKIVEYFANVTSSLVIFFNYKWSQEKKTVNKHGEYYDFESSEEVVDGFFKNVHSRIKPPGLKIIKCSFAVESIQESVFETLRSFFNTRY